MIPASAAAFRRGQWAMIGTLVAVAIIVLLAALYLPRLLKSQSSSGAAEQSAIQQANGAACSVYLSELNSAVTEYKQDHNNAPPPSLEDLKPYGVTDDMLHSPGCVFQLNPQTGYVASGTSVGAPVPPKNAPAGSVGGITIPNTGGDGGGM